MNKRHILGMSEEFDRREKELSAPSEARLTPSRLSNGWSVKDLVFLERIKEISLEDWSRLRSPESEDYSVSPAWAVFHRVEHEAGHAALMGVMKKRAHAALKKEL